MFVLDMVRIKCASIWSIEAFWLLVICPLAVLIITTDSTTTKIGLKFTGYLLGKSSYKRFVFERTHRTGLRHRRIKLSDLGRIGS